MAIFFCHENIYTMKYSRLYFAGIVWYFGQTCAFYQRELVLCSRDILASRRDFVAYKTFVRSSIRSPGVSSEFATTSIDNKSESATASIDNKSYSGTTQRSEDFTIDSTVSGKSSIGLSLDVNRKTDDSSTSGPTFKRKIADRTSYSAKQLPHRTESVSFRSSADDGEKRFKSKKVLRLVLFLKYWVGLLITVAQQFLQWLQGAWCQC